MKTKSLLPTTSLAECSTIEILEELQSRGGHPGALAEAALLCIRKSQDYNHSADDVNVHEIDRSVYFPFGILSYAQMLHTKSQRFVTLASKELYGQDTNFESARDTALDIINYAGFYAAAYPGDES